MKLDKPIVFFDLETTGLDQQQDRIVEMYMLKKNPDGTEEEWYSRFNPWPIKVNPEAEAVHGISDLDLMDEPKFSEKANEILAFIKDCDLGGYNINRFDIPMLFEEMVRSEVYHNFKTHRVVDVFTMWAAAEPRTLTGAVNRFLGEDHQYAHEAKADVVATAKIFEKMTDIYSNQFESVDEINEKTNDGKDRLDFSGKFIRENGQIKLNFGKHSGKTVDEVYKEDQGYLQWMYDGSKMPTDTRLIARKIYGQLSKTASEAQ